MNGLDVTGCHPSRLATCGRSHLRMTGFSIVMSGLDPGIPLRRALRPFRHCDPERSEGEAIQNSSTELDCFGGCAASQ
jgi:hypothetical protein